MKIQDVSRIIGGKSGLYLLLIIALSSALLITVNWFTLKTSSAIRAYINGESQYSKGEKDAGQSLILYLHSRKEEDYNRFWKNLSIPISDGRARVKMNQQADPSLIKKDFEGGNNNPEDIDKLIWLYQNFHSLRFMEHCIKTWAAGDSLVALKGKLGEEAHQKIATASLTHDDEVSLMKRIVSNNDQLSVLEREFSDTLGEIARQIGTYLIVFNSILILLLFIFIQIFASSILVKLKTKNHQLEVLNGELDSLIYSVSHDLKSPMASVQGLINLSLLEKDTNQVYQYLNKMSSAIDQQSQFIQKIIQTKKNTVRAVQLEKVSLAQLVEQCVQQHRYMEEAKGIAFTTTIETDMVYTDFYIIETILNNLVSNSIKYHDKAKVNPFITIHTKSMNDNLVIEIQDNGKGITKVNQKFIFDKFYTSAHDKKSSGIGLSLVKEGVTKLHGSIQVQSEPGIGTTFTVTLPKQKNDAVLS